MAWNDQKWYKGLSANGQQNIIENRSLYQSMELLVYLHIGIHGTLWLYEGEPRAEIARHDEEIYITQALLLLT